MKYTPEQLQAMAREALDARDSADPRFEFLVLRLVLRTGLPPEDIEHRIETLAQGVPA